MLLIIIETTIFYYVRLYIGGRGLTVVNLDFPGTTSANSILLHGFWHEKKQKIYKTSE